MKIFVSPLKLLIPLLLLPLFSISHAAEADPTTPISNKLTCQGKMLNPINDICWSCMFPIKIGGKVNLNMDNQEDNGSSPNDWFCTCTHPSRSGVTVSFWEPTHLVEVVRTPFCMVSLGGISLKIKKQIRRKQQVKQTYPIRFKIFLAARISVVVTNNMISIMPFIKFIGIKIRSYFGWKPYWTTIV